MNCIKCHKVLDVKMFEGLYLWFGKKPSKDYNFLYFNDEGELEAMCGECWYE